MSLQPIHVYNHAGGPNPKKVVIILEELGIPYNLDTIADRKSEAYIKINPNGRLPAIQDPNNNNIILWESGAIAKYLVETYDKENKLNITTNPEKWYLEQYLHFQMSGQGPYYGQGVFFQKFHSEDVPSAKKRYLEQIERVWGVLDNILKGKTYLVGEKLTYVDLCFVPWEHTINGFIGDVVKPLDAEHKYPNFWAWYQRLAERPSVKKAYGQ